MSKSIYEELLEIIDRNIFELPMGFAVLYEIRKKIEQAFKQAQKQEKLLKLYKELSNFYVKLYTMELSELSLNSNYYEIEIIKLKHQIKEKE